MASSSNNTITTSITSPSTKTTIQFHERCAPFERGCDTKEEFVAKRVTTFEACLIQPEFAQTTMQHFNKNKDSFFKMPQEFQHLKRITKPQKTQNQNNQQEADGSNNNNNKQVLILLCPSSSIPTTNNNSTASKQQFLLQLLSSELPSVFSLNKNESNNNNNTLLVLQTVSVPLFPDTPIEWIFANTVWPLSMPRLHRTVRDTHPSLLSDSSKKAASAGFDKILEEDRKYVDEKNGKNNNNIVVMTAVIVNLADASVLASCTKVLTKKKVAMIQRNTPLLLPYAVGVTSSSSSKDEAEDEDAIVNNSAEEENDDDDITQVHKHVTFEVLRKVSQIQASKNSGGYLCNDLALVTKHEPCMMCSMGLVHSRISMVFFEVENTVHGGLGGGGGGGGGSRNNSCSDESSSSDSDPRHHHYVNRIPSLNHRFPAYKIDREEKDK